MTPQEKQTYACRLRSRVRTRPAFIQLKELANRAGVSRSWLNTFCREEYANPHLRLLERLDIVLTEMCERTQ